MKLAELFPQLERLEKKEIRSMHDEYVELVFFNRDIDAWDKLLVGKLGIPKKPAGIEPSVSDQEKSQGTGGIWKNQTLFEKSFDGVTIIAKFWPWNDGVHTTLKMALLIHS